MRNGRSLRARASAEVREKYAQGKAFRSSVPREAHAELNVSKARDPLALLRASDAGRLQELLWIRYGRMMTSPLAFYRGAAAVMAYDLAATPATGIKVQCCGDAHLMNFGGFGTAERNFIFDVDDFEETLPGPWEWDLKRLAASVAIACGQLSYRPRQAAAALAACLASYREAMHTYAAMPVLEVWYSRIEASELVRAVVGASTARVRRAEAKMRAQTSAHAFPKLTGIVDGQRRIADEPPLIYHDQSEPTAHELRAMLHAYSQSLPPDRRVLFERYAYVDFALKVVGIGSVGTRCYVGLFMASEDDPLVLQVKEARPSALAPYCGGSAFAHQGERVVVGQRLMQAGSDMFLGFGTYGGRAGDVDFYVRQLRDMKTSANIESMLPERFVRYVELCGRALAHAHAKSGEPAIVAGYIGRSTTFDRAVARYAEAYVAVNKRDLAALVRAKEKGEIPARPEGAAESG